MQMTKNKNAKVNNQNTPAGDSPGYSTLSVHAGEARQKPVNSITDPIVMASTFTFENTESIISFIENDEDRGEYGRYGVPGEKVVERKMAALENAEEAVLFSSGMAALVGIFNSKLSSGDEIIFFDECYHRSREYCKKALVSLWHRYSSSQNWATTMRWKRRLTATQKC